MSGHNDGCPCGSCTIVYNQIPVNSPGGGGEPYVPPQEVFGQGDVFPGPGDIIVQDTDGNDVVVSAGGALPANMVGCVIIDEVSGVAHYKSGGGGPDTFGVNSIADGTETDVLGNLVPAGTPINTDAAGNVVCIAKKQTDFKAGDTLPADAVGPITVQLDDGTTAIVNPGDPIPAGTAGTVIVDPVTGAVSCVGEPNAAMRFIAGVNSSSVPYVGTPDDATPATIPYGSSLLGPIVETVIDNPTKEWMICDVAMFFLGDIVSQRGNYRNSFSTRHYFDFGDGNLIAWNTGSAVSIPGTPDDPWPNEAMRQTSQVGDLDWETVPIPPGGSITVRSQTDAAINVFNLAAAHSSNNVGPITFVARTTVRVHAKRTFDVVVPF